MIDEFPGEWFLYLRESKGYAAIKRQRATTTAMLARRGGKVVGEFKDADKTAFRNTHRDIDAELPPRPDFDRMLSLLPSRPGVGIAAWHADRLSRDPDEAGVIIRACRRDGGHLVATKAGGDYDVTTSNGRSHLRDDINAANDEVDHNTERMLEAKAEKVAMGLWLGGPRPFGWEPVERPKDEDGEPLLDDDGKPVRGILRLAEAEAAAVSAACADVLAGATLAGIARGWRESGFTGTRGGFLSAADVRKILLRPRNAGLVEHRGQVSAGAQWPPIVDEGTWRDVRALLADPARRTGPGAAPRWLLTGVALCGACGATMLIGCRGGSRKPSYRCSLAQRKLPRASGPHVSRDAAALDALVAYLATGRLKRPDARLLLREDNAADRTALLTADAVKKAEYDEQWDLFRAKAISAKELREGRAEIERERAGIRAALDSLDQADAVAPFLADPDGAWKSAPLDRKQALLSALMYVTVLPAPKPDGLRSPGVPSFSAAGVDVRWRRLLPSDG